MDTNLMLHTPKVSVLMPVFNGEAYLREAITSILRQTFSDFELLILNDGSTDTSAEIVSSFTDGRIRYMASTGNCGLVQTLNRGLDLARGTYIARMDCDDISLPRRLEYQVSFLDAHPEVGVCGTWYREVRGTISTIMRCAEDHSSILCGTLFNPVVGHPTVMLRKAMLDSYQLRYDPAFPHAEDYKLWSECLKYYKFANISTVLMSYRIHSMQVTQLKLYAQMESSGRVRFALLREMGLDPSDEEFEVHQFISALGRPYSNTFSQLPMEEQLRKIDSWLCKLKGANAATAAYPEPAFSRILVERWIGVVFLHFILKGKLEAAFVKQSEIMGMVPSGKEIAARFTLKRLGYLFNDVLDNFRIHR